MVNKPIYYLCCNFIWKKKNGYSSFSWHWIRHNLWWIRVSKSVLLWLFAICMCLFNSSRGSYGRDGQQNLHLHFQKVTKIDWNVETVVVVVGLVWKHPAQIFEEVSTHLKTVSLRMPTYATWLPSDLQTSSPTR